MMKKGLRKKGNMSIQVIIVAVIALVVMVVLISIFSSNITKSNKEFSKCSTAAGGKCIDSAKDCTVDGGGIYAERSGDFSDCSDTEDCCVQIG